MRRQTIRFGESLWALIEDEANLDGVTAAHWIRDACLARALWERQRRGIELGPDILNLVRTEHLTDNETMQKVIEDVLEHGRAELETTINRLPADSARWLRRLYGL